MTARPIAPATPSWPERVRAQGAVRLRLAPSGDGWSLLAPDGVLIFRAPGAQGRRRCLQFARAHGVLAMVS